MLNRFRLTPDNFYPSWASPDLDLIEGLSPAISIEQKSSSHNPRSTVGTVTEIYDYLRLLFARIGEPRCPEHNITLEAQNRQPDGRPGYGPAGRYQTHADGTHRASGAKANTSNCSPKCTLRDIFARALMVPSIDLGSIEPLEKKHQTQYRYRG